jgi:hypothetical protein
MYIVQEKNDNMPQDIRVAYEFATQVTGGCNDWRPCQRQDEQYNTNRQDGCEECVSWKKWCAAPVVIGSDIEPLHPFKPAPSSSSPITFSDNYIWPGFGLAEAMNSSALSVYDQTIMAWAVCETEEPCVDDVPTGHGSSAEGTILGNQFVFSQCFRQWTDPRVHWIHRKSYFGHGSESLALTSRKRRDHEADEYSWDRLVEIATGRGMQAAENAMIVEFGGVDPEEAKKKEETWVRNITIIWSCFLGAALVVATMASFASSHEEAIGLAGSAMGLAFVGLSITRIVIYAWFWQGSTMKSEVIAQSTCFGLLFCVCYGLGAAAGE